MPRIVLVALALLTLCGAHANAYTITEDSGGQIGAYVYKYMQVQGSGENVIIDGKCLSACTIVLGAVSRDKICVTQRAELGFHTAWNLGPDGRTRVNAEASQMLYSLYPPKVRRWIAARGGLTPEMKFLRGKELFAIYKHCDSYAQSRF